MDEDMRCRFRAKRLRDVLMPLVVKLDEPEYRCKGEEDQHGVQQNESRDAQPSDILCNELSVRVRGSES